MSSPAVSPLAGPRPSSSGTVRSFDAFLVGKPSHDAAPARRAPPPPEPEGVFG